jgi:hypothetical protein
LVQWLLKGKKKKKERGTNWMGEGKEVQARVDNKLDRLNFPSPETEFVNIEN